MLRSSKQIRYTTALDVNRITADFQGERNDGENPGEKKGTEFHSSIVFQSSYAKVNVDVGNTKLERDSTTK